MLVKPLTNIRHNRGRDREPEREREPKQYRVRDPEHDRVYGREGSSSSAISCKHSQRTCSGTAVKRITALVDRPPHGHDHDPGNDPDPRAISMTPTAAPITAPKISNPTAIAHPTTTPNTTVLRFGGRIRIRRTGFGSSLWAISVAITAHVTTPAKAPATTPASVPATSSVSIPATTPAMIPIMAAITTPVPRAKPGTASGSCHQARFGLPIVNSRWRARNTSHLFASCAFQRPSGSSR